MASRRGPRLVAGILHAIRDEHEEELKAWIREKYHPEAIFEAFQLGEAIRRTRYREETQARGANENLSAKKEGPT